MKQSYFGLLADLRGERRPLADAIVEVALKTIRLTREGSGPNPSVTLVATARVRLVRAADRDELTSERSQPVVATSDARHQPPSWRPAQSTAEAAKQYACQGRFLNGFSDWRDPLPEYRACLAQ